MESMGSGLDSGRKPACGCAEHRPNAIKAHEHFKMLLTLIKSGYEEYAKTALKN